MLPETKKKIHSYLENRYFSIRQENYFSFICHVQAGVPQDSDLSPDLINIITLDIPQTDNTILATYADDTAVILSDNSDSVEASLALQLHLNLIDNWSLKWKIKINADKSILVPFTLNKKTHQP